MSIERDELSLELRLRRMSQQPDYACDCDLPESNVPRHPWDHSLNCRWRILIEAADECAESEMCADLSTRLDELLRSTVNTLRGDPPPLVHWSHHDIPHIATLYRGVYAAAVQLIAVGGYQGDRGSPSYKAFAELVKATGTVSEEIRRDYESARSALAEQKGGDDESDGR